MFIGSTSHNTLVQLFHNGTATVVANDIVGLIISLSLPFILYAFKTRSKACVLLVTAIACFFPTILANFSSNSLTLGPLIHHPLLNVSLTALMSSSVAKGAK